MKKCFNGSSNKGFSLIELVVIIAIMAVVSGISVMSISVITGSEARKAFKKIDAELNAVKTESMSRYGEVLVLKYQNEGVVNATASGLFENADEQAVEGFYALKQVYTFTKSTTSGQAIEQKPIGQESTLLCNNRVDITLWYGAKAADPNDVEGWKDDYRNAGTFFDLAADTSDSITIQYNRANGTIENVHISSSSRSIDEDVTPQFLECHSGNRTYIMEFISGTGKHRQIR